jgi:hypothetical protein
MMEEAVLFQASGRRGGALAPCQECGRWLGVSAIVLAGALLWMPARASAEVTRLEVTTREDLAVYDYERITGRLYFAVDPAHPANTIVADLDKAPRAASGRVEFSADFYMLRPKSGGNGVALVDIVNRGRRTIFALNRAGGAADPEVGDGFLMARGYTMVAVGWEFDVRGGNLMSIAAPVARSSGSGGPITGIVRSTFIPDRREPTFTVNDLPTYAPIDPEGSDTLLTVRDRFADRGEAVPRRNWRLSGNTVTLSDGFEPGRIYELSYRAADPPVAGTGFLAVRDLVSWIKHATDAATRASQVYAFGASQSGRFLRDFLYHGFNTDERGRPVFDAALIHIAGASRLELNTRWATPITLGQQTVTSFPFADAAYRDPISGVVDGLLENKRAGTLQPRVFYTNTGVEYWGGARAAALTHTTPDGTADIALPANVRSYFFAGTQHTPGAFPPASGAVQQLLNPTDYWWSVRALLVALDQWVRDEVEPPASRYPTRAAGTLVDATDLAFPQIPGVQLPTTLSGGTRTENVLIEGGAAAGAPLPLLVPQVDADGNEQAGIRLPEVAVPLATYTGWNFRSRETGGSHLLRPLLGAYIPFPRTRDTAEAGDPRKALGERYRDGGHYLSLIETSAADLVKERYLLAEDVPAIMKRAAAHWELATGETR